METYLGIYEELSGMLDDEEALKKIYDRFNGLSVTFPKKLYSKEYVCFYIKAHYRKDKVQDIARHLNMTDRRVLQIVSELGIGGGRKGI